MDVSHAQAGKLLTQAHALKAVYSKLLKGVSKRQAFEESAEFLEVQVSTLKQWERDYRTKGHIKVSATVSLQNWTHRRDIQHR